MDLDLIPVPPSILAAPANREPAEVAGPEEKPIAGATHRLLNVRNRLMGYALTVGEWPALN